MHFNTKLPLNILVPSFSLTICAGVVQAACVPGDCTALGYTKNESNCEGDIIRCPFDTTKVFCKEKPRCTENKCEGFPLTVKPSNAKYSECKKVGADCKEQTVYKIDKCDDGYVLEGNACYSASPDTCTPNDCEGYNSTVIPKHTKTYSTCKKVTSDCTEQIVYKSDTCEDGYVIYERGLCESPSVDADGCRQNCTATNRKQNEECRGGSCSPTPHTEIDNCGCEYVWYDCYCASDH